MKPTTTKVVRFAPRPADGLRWVRNIVKTASTAASPSESPSTSSPKPPAEPVQLPPRLATRNLLKSSLDLAKRTVEWPKPFEDAVNKSLKDLEESRKPVIAFCGDFKSGAHEIVTALLEEPLSDDQTRRNALVGRFDALVGSGSTDVSLKIRSSDSLNRTPDLLEFKSSWLARNGVDLLEISTASNSTLPPADLLTANHVVLVTDNIRFTSQPSFASYIKTLAHHPSLQIVLNRINKSTTVYQDEYTLTSEIKAILEDEMNAENREDLALKISVVSSNDALEAIDIFRTVQNTSDAPAAAKAASMELYQAKHKASSMSDLSAALASVIPQEGTEQFIPQSRTGAFISSTVLSSCQASIDTAAVELLEAEMRVKNLRTLTQTDIEGARFEFFTSAEDASEKPDAEDIPVVNDSLTASRTAVQRILNKYNWWNLAWRVDDLHDEVVGAVAEHYAKDLRDNIHFHAGKLTSINESLLVESDATVTFPPTSPFNSAILQNNLSQISRSTSPNVAPPLVAPISSRQSQLMTYLVPQLQSRAERAVASFYALSFGSVGAAWASSPILFDAIGVETAIGAGALGVATSLRFVLMGGWERAMKKWWEGWDRVGQGLGRDVKAAYDQQVVPQLKRKPEAAADGLQELVDKRAKDVAEVEGELNNLTRTLRTLQARLRD